MRIKNIIDNKVNGSSGGGASLLDHTVTFKADGQTYAISSVKGTQTVAEPNPHPTSSLGNFAGWYIGEDRATFPLEVNSDIEINALFKNARVDIEWNEAGLWYAHATQVYTEVKKTGTGFCLAGHIVLSTNNYRYGVLVSDNADNITTSSVPAVYNFEYDGNTYYYKAMSVSNSAFRKITDKSIDLSSYIQTTTQKDIAIKLLDYYFNRV